MVQMPPGADQTAGRLSASFASFDQFPDELADLLQRAHEADTAFARSPAPLAIVGLDGTILRINEALAELTDWDPDAVIGSAALDLIFAEDIERFVTWGLELLDNGDRLPALEGRLLTTEGRPVWVRFDPRVVQHADGELSHHIIQCTNISDRKEAEAARDESDRRFQTLVDSLPDPVVRLLADGTTSFANRAARQLFDIDDDGRIKWEAALRLETDLLIQDTLSSATQRRAEFRALTKSGHRVLESRFIPEFDHAGSAISVLMIASDLTERRRTEAELTYRATHDSLTGLPNRVMFATHLDLALARVRRTDGMIGVVFFDLDHFKIVNDSMGHQAGDELLQQVAMRLRDQLRGSDVVARLGGDEFVVLLDAYEHVEQIQTTVDRLQAALARPMLVAGRQVIVGSSAGIAIADRTTTDGDDLLRWADAAMYRAKGAGRARSSIVDDELMSGVRQRMHIEQQLRGALERDEFEVHYQPEVDLENGAVIGCEALLRWRTDGELLSAATFIELAEENGQIIPIGEWVFDTACRQLAEWQPRLAGQPFTMRVNLSARQFDQTDLPARVRDILETTAVEPERICLEITETALMAEPAAAAAVLAELAGLGVHLAIDDFGTGYSSLNYLKRFPVSVLKIDRSFVDGLPEDAEDSVIVATIVGLARSLGLEVTAEGVETPEQAAELLNHGCRRAQGYLYSKPQPADVMTGFLGRRLPLSSELDSAFGSDHSSVAGTITTGHGAW